MWATNEGKHLNKWVEKNNKCRRFVTELEGPLNGLMKMMWNINDQFSPHLNTSGRDRRVRQLTPQFIPPDFQRLADSVPGSTESASLIRRLMVGHHQLRHFMLNTNHHKWTKSHYEEWIPRTFFFNLPINTVESGKIHLISGGKNIYSNTVLELNL